MTCSWFNIPGSGVLFSGDNPDAWWVELGTLQTGETLLNTRFSVTVTGSQSYGHGGFNDFGNNWAIACLGVTIFMAASDPGPPAVGPSLLSDTDWIMRDGFALSPGVLHPASTDEEGAFDWVANPNNPYVSKGMRLVPEGFNGYVYAGIDMVQAFADPKPEVQRVAAVWNLLVLGQNL